MMLRASANDAAWGVSRGGSPADRRFVVWTLAAALVTFAFFQLFDAIGRAGSYALYVWSGVLTTLLLVHVWTLVSNIFTVTQDKRLYGFIGAGSVMGAIAEAALPARSRGSSFRRGCWSSPRDPSTHSLHIDYGRVRCTAASRPQGRGRAMPSAVRARVFAYTSTMAGASVPKRSASATAGALAAPFLLVAVACSSGDDHGSAASPDATPGDDAAQGAIDAADGAATASDGGDATTAGDGAAFDAGDGDGGSGCFLATVGVTGECMTVASCAARGSFMSTPGYCAGPADIECCTKVPSTADNPPVPAGWVLMQQASVTPAMTTWAVAILKDPTTYPMFSTTTQLFGALEVMARVEWHPPDFQNAVIHRGVTLYERAG